MNLPVLPPGAQMGLIAIAVILGVLAVKRLVTALTSLYVVAQPDEWLLRVRNGRLVDAGVGITLWRLPGDIVVRFSSTMQRVGFWVSTLTVDKIPVIIDGFIFWSVARGDDAPFRAFSRLGIANTLRISTGLKHPKHLLTTQQHKAFQQILVATVQRYAVTRTLEETLSDQDGFVRALTERLRESTREMGVNVDQVQLLGVRPGEAEMLAALSVRENQRVREEAESVRRAVEDRMARAVLESETVRARESAEANRDREAFASQMLLELEQRRGKLLEQQRLVREQEMAQERDLALLKLDAESAVELRTLAAQNERTLVAEKNALEIAHARIAREALECEARNARVRSEAHAARDAVNSHTEAEENKSEAVRAHERALLLTERVAGSVKVTDARWVCVGNDGPAASVGSLIAGVSQVVKQVSGV